MIMSNIPAGNRPAVYLPLGQLVSTPGALEALAKADQNGIEFIDRHRHGDWGEVNAEDWAANDRAILDGDRILSAYSLKDQTKVWIITEADRSVTTILLPDEY
jgi:hypothetical protein